MKNITAAALVVFHAYELSDKELTKLHKQYPGPSALADAVISHPKFTLEVTKNSDGTYNIID